MLFRFLNDLDAVGELGAAIRDEIKKLDGATQDTKEKVKASLDNLADAATTHIKSLEASHESATEFLKLVNASKDYLSTVFEVHAANLQQIVGEKGDELNPKVLAAVQKLSDSTGAGAAVEDKTAQTH